MKYTPSGLASEFSGSIGSTTAGHNRFGPYFRTRTIPVNPNSPAQVLIRNILKAASQQWRLITAAQRAAWEAVALTIPRLDSLGRVYYQTGHQFFVSTQLAVKQYDPLAAYIADPMTVVTPVDLLSLTPTCVAGGVFSLAYTTTPLAALSKLVVEATPQLSPGVSFVKGGLYRQIFISAAAAVSPANILAAYNAMFGAQVLGKKIGLRVKVISSTGGRSNTLIQLITVA